MPRSFTRGLPHPGSPGERRLYDAYLKGRIKGARFNVPVGPYYVDVLFPDAKLVVEVDGKTHHSSPAAQLVDRRRDMELGRAGYRVMRYSHDRVKSDLPSVLSEIESQLRRRSEPDLPPALDGETLLQRLERGRELELARNWATRTVKHVEDERGAVAAAAWEAELGRALSREFGLASSNDLATLRERVARAVALWEARVSVLGLDLRRIPRATRRPGA
jgi:very-short-patch-repair endonuclease